MLSSQTGSEIARANKRKSGLLHHFLDGRLRDKRKPDPERRAAVSRFFADISPWCASIMVRAMDAHAFGATFHLFDKENVGSGVQLARGGGCRGCAVRGCRGCAVRGCAVRRLRGRLRGRQLLRILGILPRVLSPTT